MSGDFPISLFNPQDRFRLRSLIDSSFCTVLYKHNIFDSMKDFITRK